MKYVSVFLAVTTIFAATPLAGDELNEEVLQQTGVKGGFVAYLGCADAEANSRLFAGGSYLVQYLDTSARRVSATRRSIAGGGQYGRVSVDRFDGQHVPYVENLVNLLVVPDDSHSVSAAEIARVIAPQGVVLVRSALYPRPSNLEREPTELKGWTLYRKRVPKEIDEWGHFLHGADNNAISQDTAVGPPRHMQWLSGPRWTRHHDTDKGTYPTIRAVVSANGRLYYLFDETHSSNMKIPSRWALVARDGFSGVQLWRRPIQAETYSRDLEQVWRQIIADGDKVYAQLAGGTGLSELDGATGEVLQTYKGSEGFREVIKDGENLLFVGKDDQIIAIDAGSGERRWSWDSGDYGEIIRLTLAAADGRVFVKATGAAYCLAADTGDELWTHPLPKAKKNVFLKWPRERLIHADGVILVSFGGDDPTELNRDVHEFLGSHPRVRKYRGRLAALDAAKGTKLWETGYMPNLESAPGEIYVNGDVVWLGPGFAEARDLHSGKERRDLAGLLEKLWTDGHHYRCYPGKATSRYLLTGKRGIEFFDTVGENHSRNNWVRTTCRIGYTPCNGFVYLSPHSCGCYMEALIKGFWALAAEDSRSWGEPDALETRLEKGPAYGKSGRATGSTEAAEWATYRGNNTRSGSVETVVSAKLEKAWDVTVGGRLSAITIADSKLFVAQMDKHTVHALDVSNGEPLWHFVAGGRVDSPPTFFNGLLYFGSRDGFIYCLRARDGELAWRFQAAPRRLKSVAFEQVESLWPVVGSVLIEKGVVYASAGRSSNLDGGIYLYGLDPTTGQVVHRRQLTSPSVGAMEPPDDGPERTKNKQNWSDYKTYLAPDKSDSFSMEGALPDVMSADEDSIFMRQMRFDRSLIQREEKRQHLFSTSSLLDGTEHHRSYWVLGSGNFRGLPVAFPWIVGSNMRVPYGLALAFDDKTVWCVRGGAGRKKQAPEYCVVALQRQNPGGEESGLPDFSQVAITARTKGAISRERGSGASDDTVSWRTELPARPRAVVHAGKYLFIGGMKRAGFDTAVDNWTAGNICVMSSDDGGIVNNVALKAPPVWDGMAVANGRLYVSMENGTVVCLAKANVSTRR